MKRYLCINETEYFESWESFENYVECTNRRFSSYLPLILLQCTCTDFRGHVLDLHHVQVTQNRHCKGKGTARLFLINCRKAVRNNQIMSFKYCRNIRLTLVPLCESECLFLLLYNLTSRKPKAELLVRKLFL